jgi:hypothetical protein
VGSGFAKAVQSGMDGDIIHRAREFIDFQLAKWEKEGNSVLAKRYKIVKQYYEQHRPGANGYGA